MNKIILLLITFLLLNGCSTSYQPQGFSGGYTDFALSSDVYRVTFQGNGYTSYNKVQMYLLRRCSELTLEKGYNYFLLMANNSSIDTSAYVTPSTINSSSSTTYSSYSSQIYTNTSINPGQIYYINKHGASAIIKMFKTQQLNTFDAKIILSNFQQQ